MRILFLQRQPCIRTLKYAVALRAACPDIELSFAYQGRTLGAYYGSGDELFGAWWDLGGGERPADALRRVLDDLQPDVVHSHNLPDSLTVLALEAVDGQVPVVHDVHDLQSLRTTPYNDGFPEPADPLGLERIAIEGARAVITVSPELLDVIDSAYRLPADTLVIPNYALERDLPEITGRSEGFGAPRIAYQGSLGTDGGHYDLRDIFRAIAGASLTLHVHPNRRVAAYHRIARRSPAMHVHAPLSPADLMRVLPRYDAGWAGFNSGLNRAHLDTVLPNKLFEYLGSGLPVLTLRGHRALARFVVEEGVGVVLDEASHAGEAVQATDLAGLKQTVLAARARFTFEACIGAVVDLYESLVRSPGGRISPAETPLGSGFAT